MTSTLPPRRAAGQVKHTESVAAVPPSVRPSVPLFVLAKEFAQAVLCVVRRFHLEMLQCGQSDKVCVCATAAALVAFAAVAVAAVGGRHLGRDDLTEFFPFPPRDRARQASGRGERARSRPADGGRTGAFVGGDRLC